MAGPRERKRPGIKTLVRVLPQHHVTVFEGIRVTTPARVVFDLATLVSRSEFERAVNQVQVLKLATKPQLLALLEEVRGLPGAPALAAALQVEGATRSGGEDELWRLLVASGLPLPKRNHEFFGHECDCVWEDLMLVVELDSHQYHDTAAQFAKDHAKTEELEAHGVRVLRIPGRRIAREPKRAVARIARAIGEQTARYGPRANAA